MSRSRSFSIYLLKPGFHATNSLKKDHGMELVSAKNIPKSGTVYVSDNPPHHPWWKDYFGISKSLDQISKGALVFLPTKDRVFALSFGYAYHNLNDESYEYDFGLLVTLNCVDPDKLRSTEIVEPGSSRRKRTQLPAMADLTYFDFDKDSSIIKNLVGKVREEHLDYFQHATGSSNLRISSGYLAKDLVELCAKLLDLYQSKIYRTSFPNIHNIEPVRDPQKLRRLNRQLLSAFKEKKDDLYITVPDILNYNEGFFVSFSGAGPSLNYPDLVTGIYRQYLEENGLRLADITEEMLRSHRLWILDADEKTKDSYRIYRCLVFDIEFGNESRAYHLSEGNWYAVEKDYLARIEKFLNNYYEDRSMPAYNHKTEGDYNRHVAKTIGRFICLDETNISPAGQKQVEPCDLYITESGRAVLNHIKVSTRSSKLSHLFAQAIVSLQLILSETESSGKLVDLILKNLGSNPRAAYTNPVSGRLFKIVYGIVTSKNKTHRSKNLPLFSRINLKKSIETLRMMGMPVSYCFIEDRTTVRSGIKKARKKRKKPA